MKKPFYAKKKYRLLTVFATLVLGMITVKADAALYTNSFGSLVPGYFQNDDSSFGPQNLGFNLNFFGTTYSNFFINNNGNVTFGADTFSYSPLPLNTQTTRPMIAPYWTDLDTRSGAANAGVYLTQTAGQDIITWNNMGYFSVNYSGIATFQLVLNDPNNIPVGEGSIGFFYGSMGSGSDGHQVTAGFGDGLAAINPGEISVASGYSHDVSQQVNDTHIWFNVNNGTPVEAPPVPEPSTFLLLGAGLAGIAGYRLRRKKA